MSLKITPYSPEKRSRFNTCFSSPSKRRNSQLSRWETERIWIRRNVPLTAFLFSQQTNVSEVTAAHDRDLLFKSNQPFIIKLQAQIRGYLSRKRYCERLKFLNTQQPAIVKIQVRFSFICCCSLIANRSRSQRTEKWMWQFGFQPTRHRVRRSSYSYEIIEVDAVIVE